MLQMTLRLLKMMISCHKEVRYDKSRIIDACYCFGAVMGSFIGNIIMLIKFAIEDYKDKKRRREEEAKAVQNSEE